MSTENLPSGIRCGQCSNYVCNDTLYPTKVTFADGRVVTLQQEMEEGRYYLNVSPKSEYPKPCGICSGEIASADDLDWHGYGNCREIPDAMMQTWGLAHVINMAPPPRESTEPFDIEYRNWYLKAREAVKG